MPKVDLSSVTFDYACSSILSIDTLLAAKQVLVYSLEKYDEKFLIPELHALHSPSKVRTVRVSLSLDTADLAKG